MSDITLVEEQDDQIVNGVDVDWDTLSFTTNAVASFVIDRHSHRGLEVALIDKRPKLTPMVSRDMVDRIFSSQYKFIREQEHPTRCQLKHSAVMLGNTALADRCQAKQETARNKSSRSQKNRFSTDGSMKNS